MAGNNRHRMVSTPAPCNAVTTPEGLTGHLSTPFITAGTDTLSLRSNIYPWATLSFAVESDIEPSSATQLQSPRETCKTITNIMAVPTRTPRALACKLRSLENRKIKSSIN